MGPFEAYDRIVALGASASHAGRVAEMRAAYQARTGAFAPEDAWFEARSRAFWDDAVTTQGFARQALESRELGDDARPWALAMDRAHRGLFRAAGERGEREQREPIVVEDVLGGAAFVVHAADPGSRDALHAAGGLFDARLVATLEPPEVAILPGAVFHPEDATDTILELLRSARASSLAPATVLDALLRMERRLRSLSRVKAAYAYRESALSSEATTTTPTPLPRRGAP